MTENILLVWALLLYVAVIAGKVAYRFGAPALLLFLGVGMMFGLHFIKFESFEFTQFIGMIALCIILFSGGMDTKFSEIRPILGPGIVLATLGVVITAAVTGVFIYFFPEPSLPQKQPDGNGSQREKSSAKPESHFHK